MKNEKFIEKKYYLLMIVVSLFIGFNHANIVDNDILWHFKLGEHILQNGISMQDPFSWQEGLSWISQQWLFDIFIYIITTKFGMLGFSISLSLTFFLVIYIFYKNNKNNIKSIHFFIFFIFLRFFMSDHFFNRPALYSIILISLLLVILMKNSKQKKHYLYMFFLGLIMSNIHGGPLMMCIIIIIIYAILDYILYRLGKKNNIKNIIFDIKALFLFIIGSLLNPYFYNIYIVGLKVPSMETTQHIAEWQPFTVSSFKMICIIIFILFTIITIAASNEFRKLKRHAFLSLAITCAFFIMSLKMFRGLPILTVFIMIFDFKYFQEFVHKIYFKLFKKREESIFDTRLFKTGIYITFILAILLNMPKNKLLYSIDYNSFEKIVEEQSPYSYEIINYMKENFDDNTRVLNIYNDGNYMLFHDIKVFVDTRQYPYDKDFKNNESLNDLLDALYSTSYYNKLMDVVNKYNIEYLYWSEPSFVNYDVIIDFQEEWDVVIKSKTDYNDFNQYLFKLK